MQIQSFSTDADVTERGVWVSAQAKQCDNADRSVLEFIYNVVNHTPRNEEAADAIYHLFHSGYCYYFANMLQVAFGRGDICLAAPYGHVVWVDNGVAYDVGGIADSEYAFLIPISYLGNTVDGFKHVPGNDYAISPAEAMQIIRRYYVDNNLTCAERLQWCEEVLFAAEL